MTRTIYALATTLLLVAAGCGVGLTYHPGYVYYDTYRRPYTYVEYGGGYRTVYVEPQHVSYRGGVAVVGGPPGYYSHGYARPPQGGYMRQPQGGVYVAPPRGAVEVNSAGGGRGAVEVNGR